MVRRMLSLVRNAHHGGTLLYLPPDRAAECCGQNPYLTLKYAFADEEPRQRVRTLTVRLMNALAEAYGRLSEERAHRSEFGESGATDPGSASTA
jgi:hypothetical protein